MPAIATVNLYTRIPVDLNAKLEEQIKATGQTKQSIIQTALEEYLKKGVK